MPMLTSQPRVAFDATRSNKIRFLFYAHDTFGLGHLRRTLSLATHFTAALPNAQVLIVTGSPLAHSFTLPPRTDIVKIPAVTKQDNGAYRARNLDLDLACICDLRATLLLETARAYLPDVFIVDHAPQGLKGEVLPTLAMLRNTQPDCLRVLGLRDIVDASQSVRKTWAQEGIYRTLENDYDLILVYGSQELYDIGAEYALPATVERRVRYCGYLDRLTDASPTVAETRADSSAERLVVLTAGGGGDGFPMMRAYLLGLRQCSTMPFSSVLLTGPLMDAGEQSELRELASRLPTNQIKIETFLTDPLPLLASADLVVAMAGYNTTCELLAMRQRVLFVPRATPRQEQLIRASALAKHGLAQMIHPDSLTPAAMLARVQQSLVQPRPQEQQLSAAGISFRGQTLARAAIIDELDSLRIQRWITNRRVLVQAA